MVNPAPPGFYVCNGGDELTYILWNSSGGSRGPSHNTEGLALLIYIHCASQASSIISQAWLPTQWLAASSWISRGLNTPYRYCNCGFSEPTRRLAESRGVLAMPPPPPNNQTTSQSSVDGISTYPDLRQHNCTLLRVLCTWLAHTLSLVAPPCASMGGADGQVKGANNIQ